MVVSTSWPRRAGAAALATSALLVPPAVDAAAADVAPGEPGRAAVWTPADKVGFGTATTGRSKVWFTLRRGVLTEVYYPTLGSPSVRELDFVVSDGRSVTQRVSTATRHVVRLADPRSLTFEQVDTARSGRYRLTRRYVADPERPTVLVDVRFESLDGRPYRLYVLYDPALSNDGSDDRGRRRGRVLLAGDRRAASALRTRPALRRTSSGYLGTSDGWTDLRHDHRLDWTYATTRRGNVVQTALTPLSGRAGARRLTLALGFGRTGASAAGAAARSLAAGFGTVAARYARGWSAYLRSLTSPPPAVAQDPGLLRTYQVSLMVLAAHEDKTYRGGFVASPSMPWAWNANTIEKPSGAYHLVWSRDLYQIATAQLAAGDRAAAERALDYLFDRQQKRDGSFPQNSVVSGRAHWTTTQMDEVALPIVLAWQLGRTDAATYRPVRRAADYIVRHGPRTRQERWENQSGYSPATIAAEIAGLICAADLSRRAGDTGAAARYEAIADRWQAAVERWTVTSNGPLSPSPYYLRITKDANPDAGTTYKIGDSGPSRMDQRRVVDPSFLELVRLGVKRADDPNIARSLAVVDQQLRVDTPNGPFWHRYSYDGYGERRDGGPWDIGRDDTFRTFGRAWPIFAGERGEYELAAGRPADAYLAAMAAAGNESLMLPEQVWDGRAPTGRPGFVLGEPTFSATPLAWTHAQFVRLAWSIAAGRPVERPAIVSCRYTGVC